MQLQHVRVRCLLCSGRRPQSCVAERAFKPNQNASLGSVLLNIQYSMGALAARFIHWYQEC